MTKGLVIGLISMVFWGLVFVLPLYTPEFSAFEISIGRFIFYGLVSTIFLLVKGGLKKLPLAFWKIAVVFAMTSSLIYYIFIVLGIRWLGAAFGTALCSLLPIYSALYGNYKKKVLTWKSLFLPLLLLLIGLFLIHYQALHVSDQASNFTLALGIILISLATFMWVWYSVHNAEFLNAHTHIQPYIWSSFIGIVCLIGGGGAAIFMLFAFPDSLYLTQANSSEITRFLVASFVNGFAGTWLTLYLWNIASRNVPIAILGQLSVFEVMFGLLYIYLKTQTFPTPIELSGVILIFIGLLSGLRQVSLVKNKSKDREFNGV